jgi:hypothetical protein
MAHAPHLQSGKQCEEATIGGTNLGLCCAKVGRQRPEASLEPRGHCRLLYFAMRFGLYPAPLAETRTMKLLHDVGASRLNKTIFGKTSPRLRFGNRTAGVWREYPTPLLLACKLPAVYRAPGVTPANGAMLKRTRFRRRFGQGASWTFFAASLDCNADKRPGLLDRGNVQAPPMPSTIRPVPPHLGQAEPSMRPLPWHCGQISSPVPGVPGAASSPGLSF